MTGGAGAPAPAPAEGLAVEVLTDDPDRNWTHICVDLLAPLGEAGPRLQPMPAPLADLDAAAARAGAGEEEA